MKTYYKHCSIVILVCLCVFLNACTVVYKSAGDVIIGFAEDEAVPYMMASNDVALGCSMTEAFTPFLLGFSRVTAPPDQLAILLYLMAGNCIEIKAWEEELRYLRAVHTKNSIEAQDARIAQQRLLSLAAHRQLIGYHHLSLAFAEPGNECPELKSESEQLYWLVGLLNGMQAIMNDIASSGTVEVPMDIGSKVGRAAVCLDNNKWWGVPDAIQAAIMITIPGKQKGKTNPEQMMKHSMEIGLEQGISITQVLAAQVYLGQGKLEQVKQIIRNHAKLSTQKNENHTYNILNQVSRLQIQAISDRLWTEATGKRTPVGKLGSFWDDTDQIIEIIDIDEIL